MKKTVLRKYKDITDLGSLIRDNICSNDGHTLLRIAGIAMKTVRTIAMAK